MIEMEIAKKLTEMSQEELMSLLMSIKMENWEAFQLIKEKIEEIIY